MQAQERIRRSRRSGSRWRPGCRCCCGARPAPARRPRSGPWREAMGLPCETVIASIREPSDFAGLPIVVGDGVRFAPPGVGAAAGRGRARPAVPRRAVHRAARRAGRPAAGGARTGGRRPRRCRTRSPWWPRPTRLSRPRTAGTCPRRWPTGSATWPGRPTRGRWPTGWPAAGPRRWSRRCPTAGRPRRSCARGLVAAFLHVRPALACAPPTDAASAGRGWPSPRTWEMAARLMAAAGAAGAADEARSALIRGAVGDGRRGGVPGLAGGDGPARPGAGAGRPGLVPAARTRRPGLRRARRDRRRGGREPDPGALGGRLAGARPGRRCRARTWPRSPRGCWPGAGPTGAALPAEVRLFAPVLRDAGLWPERRG